MHFKSYLTDKKIIFMVLFIINIWGPFAKYNYTYKIANDMPVNYDFSAYYLAGKAFQLDENPYKNNKDIRLNIDNTKLNDRIYSRKKYCVGCDTLSRFIYPPTMLPLLSIISIPSYKYSRLVWLIITFSSFLMVIILYGSIYKSHKRKMFYIIGLLILFTSPHILKHIRTGQIDLISISFVFVGLYFYTKKYRKLSVLFTVAAILVKIRPAFLLAYYVFYKKDFKYLLYVIVALFCIVGISLIWIDIKLYSDFIFKILPTYANGRARFTNQSIIRFIYNSNYVWLGKYVSIIMSITLSFWLFSLNHVKKDLMANKFEKNDLYIIIIIISTMLLFSGVSWNIAYVWYIIPNTMLFLHEKKYSKQMIIGILCVSLSPRDYPVFNSINIIGAILLSSYSIMKISKNDI